MKKSRRNLYSNPVAAIEKLEDRTLLTPFLGVPDNSLTVITHGFQDDSNFPDWATDMATAISQRNGYNCTQEQIENSIVSYDTNNFEVPDNSCPSLLLFDWAEKSGLLHPGSANSDQVAGRLAKLVTQRAGEELIDIHFIGHSRGSYVNADAIRRIADSNNYTTLQITDNDTEDRFADINSQGHITWRGEDGVNLWDGNQTNLLPNSHSPIFHSDESPLIADNDFVAWQNDRKVYRWDGNTTNLISPDNEEAMQLAINDSGDVAYRIFRKDKDDLLGSSWGESPQIPKEKDYTNIGEIEINNNREWAYEATVVEDRFFGIGGFRYSYYHTLRTSTEIIRPGEGGIPQNPKINEQGNIIYNLLDNGDISSIRFWNKETSIDIAESEDGRFHQLNDLDHVVWQEDQGIHYWNGTTTTILPSSIGGTRPQINNNNQVVWRTDQGIYSWSQQTSTIQISQANNPQEPKINDKGDITWTAFDGNDNEVFFATTLPRINYLQMTTLDPQNYGLDGNLRNIVEEKGKFIDLADNYYQTNDIVKGFHLSGALNIDLTNELDIWPGREQGPGNGNHTQVHDWYHGTIDTSNFNSERYKDVPKIGQQERETLYPLDSWENGKKVGYYWSLFGQGFEERPVEVIGNEDLFVTISSKDPKIDSTIKSVNNPSPDNTPPNAQFPLGFFDLNFGDVDSEIVLTYYLPPDVQVNKYYKFGPEPNNPIPHWYDFGYDGRTGAKITDNTITLHLIDGERGDDDLTVNGFIADPGAPAYLENIVTTNNLQRIPNFRQFIMQRQEEKERSVLPSNVLYAIPSQNPLYNNFPEEAPNKKSGPAKLDIELDSPRYPVTLTEVVDGIKETNFPKLISSSLDFSLPESPIEDTELLDLFWSEASKRLLGVPGDLSEMAKDFWDFASDTYQEYKKEPTPENQNK